MTGVCDSQNSSKEKSIWLRFWMEKQVRKPTTVSAPVLIQVRESEQPDTDIIMVWKVFMHQNLQTFTVQGNKTVYSSQVHSIRHVSSYFGPLVKLQICAAEICPL